MTPADLLRSLAICDYVFVLTKKFESFIERKRKAEQTQKQNDLEVD